MASYLLPAGAPLSSPQAAPDTAQHSDTTPGSGFEFNTAYAAPKFGLEGWMESLALEVAPFGITTTIVNPGMFRTELLTEESGTYAEPSIADYAERGAAQRAGYEAQNGRQAGDPAKLAQATPHDRRSAASATPFHRWCRCRCRRRADVDHRRHGSGALPRRRLRRAPLRT
jgi:NAD(P)-dependent dehydrogenase (short-subunit alcohol dehydrogenase family)